MRRGSTPVLERQPMLPNSGAGEWFTPPDLFKDIESKYGPFSLDVAADETNSKCEEYFDVKQDGRLQTWHGRVWCNPPYVDLIKWVKKAYEETQAGNCEIAVILLPAQTSTQWFHEYALPFAELYWIRGKRRFGAMKGTAFNGSVAVVFRSEAEKARMLEAS
jgi:phage N-6-adenine-methyltransferase